MPTIKNIENLYFNATNGTLNANNIAGVEAVEIENAAGAHTVTLGAAQKLALTNINNAAAGVGTAVLGSAAGGITLNNVVDTAVTPNGAQNLDVRTTDASLNLTASTAASNINLTNTVVANQGRLTTLNIDGDAALRVNAANTYTNLTTVDASANTGGVNFVQGVRTTGDALAFTGGAGNDRVDVSVATNNVGSRYVLDGGEGRDTLAISGAGLTAPAVSNIQNFEVLEVRGATTQDASFFDAKNTLESLVVANTGGAQAMNVTNLAATAKDGIVVNHNGVVGNTTTLSTTVKGFVAGGTTDEATITVNASAAGSVLNLTFDNVDVLNLVSNTAVAGNGNTNVINLTATDAEKIVVTGNTATTVAPSAASVGITEVDASGLVLANGTTAGLTFTQAAAATQSLLVTGSNGVDTITVNSVKGTVVANGGNDVITFSAAATALADQSVNLSAKDFVAAGALGVTYTAGVGGFEVINFSSDIEAKLVVGGVNLGTTNVNQTVNAAINGQNSVAWDNVGKVLQFDVNGDGVFNAADDFAITLTGTGTAVTAVNYDATNDFFVLS